ncbi:MAG TPA: RimK family alpha-L-glutamate ligase [Solirubrobacteraceae bacterium]|nr:RimK family alpha-L-glutamate ligase [Solirubrobacteraceae bacterium]
MTARLKVAVLGASGSWHSRGLIGALEARGHEVLAIPATRLRSVVDSDGAVQIFGPDGAALCRLDLLIVRGLPRGSLEQVIFRMDALHVLAEQGVRCVNPPRAIEQTIDKSWASAVLALAAVPTPPTVVCERYEDAMQAFEALGGDVVVKPLFGAMGNGIVRVEDRDVAHRVFRALELERTVYYVQRCVAPAGRRDLRVLVVAGEVAGAMERATDSWRANVARGARPRGVVLDEAHRELALAAAAAVGADVAGVDLLVGPDGEAVVLEVNGIPGWQALQSVCERDLTEVVVDACEALVKA